MQEFFSFDELHSKVNPRDVGYKALLFGDLHNAGFPVQNGFVIGSQIFKEFLVMSGIREKLFLFLKQGKKDKIVDLLLAKKVPEIEEKIVAECSKSGIKLAFLQSSAVFKDHKFLVTDVSKKELMHSVKQCWASLFVNKRLEKLNSKNLFSGVIVQHSLGVQKSGFLYTDHPTGKMVVEVVKPKRYYFYVEKSDWSVEHLNEFPSLDSPLSLKEKDMVGKLGKNLEAHYGESSKVSWVLSNRLYMTGYRLLTSNDNDYLRSQSASSELRLRS